MKELLNQHSSENKRQLVSYNVIRSITLNNDLNMASYSYPNDLSILNCTGL